LGISEIGNFTYLRTLLFLGIIVPISQSRRNYP
jgi:hypothetical protein